MNHEATEPLRPGTRNPSPGTEHLQSSSQTSGVEDTRPGYRGTCCGTDHPQPSSRSTSPDTDRPRPGHRSTSPNTEPSQPSSRTSGVEHAQPGYRGTSSHTEHPLPSSRGTFSGAERSRPGTVSGAQGWRLSRPLVLIAALSLMAGVVSGGFLYLNRSPQLEPHLDGTAAWLPHLLLLALALVIGHRVLGRATSPVQLILAPLSTSAAKRLTHTLFSTFRHPTALLRLLLSLPLLALLLYSPWRIGLQVLAGLDPNFTVNAWGGPSYLGALACHYLDAALLIAATAALLNRLLLPAPPTDNTR